MFQRKERSSVCVFDCEENPITGLRQWQQIHALETYIIDVQGISYGTLGACLIGENIFGEGRGAGTLDSTMRGEAHMGRKIFGVGGSEPEGHHAFDI